MSSKPANTGDPLGGNAGSSNNQRRGAHSRPDDTASDAFGPQHLAAGSGFGGAYGTNEARVRANAARRAAILQEDSTAADADSDYMSLDSLPAHARRDANGEVLIRKKKRRHKKRRRVLKVLLIVLIVLLVLAAAAAAFVYYNIQAGQQALQEASQPTEIETIDESETEDNGRTVTYNGHTYKYNENMVSVAVIGFDRDSVEETDGQAGQADAVMVLAFDTETGEVSAIGVPRDSMVDVGEYVGDAYLGQEQMQLCLAYSFGDGAETSCEYTVTAVSRALYNIPITYYYALDMSGVGPLNDAIGGVTLTALQTIPNTTIVEGQETLLMGDNALKYVQWRDTSVLTSSLDRQARQAQYVQAFASKVISASQGSVGTFVDLWNTLGEYSVTNLGLSEYTYLASTALGGGMTSLNVTTLQGEAVRGDMYVEYYLDETNVYETVLDVYYTQID